MLDFSLRSVVKIQYIFSFLRNRNINYTRIKFIFISLYSFRNKIIIDKNINLKQEMLNYLLSNKTRFPESHFIVNFAQKNVCFCDKNIK